MEAAVPRLARLDPSPRAPASRLHPSRSVTITTTTALHPRDPRAAACGGSGNSSARCPGLAAASRGDRSPANLGLPPLRLVAAAGVGAARKITADGRRLLVPIIARAADGRGTYPLPHLCFRFVWVVSIQCGR